MSKFLQNYEGGTAGAALTTANTDGGTNTAFTAVDAATVFSSTQKKDGSLSALLPPADATTGIQRWADPTPAKNLRTRVYFHMSTAHAADYTLFETRVGTFGTAERSAMLLMTAANQLRLRAYGSGSAVTAWTSTATMPLGQWVRMEVLIEQGTTTSNGRARIALYVGDSTTALEDSGWIEGLNLRGAVGPVTMIYLGKIIGPAYPALYMDAVAVDTGTDYAASFIGPAQVPLATPTGLTATSSTSAVSVALSWGAVAGASSYQIQPQVQSGATWTDMSVITVTGTSRTLTSADGLLPGTNYQALVRAMP